MNAIRQIFICLIFTTLIFGDAPNDEAELSQKNRITLYTLWPYSLLRIGLEYERTLWIWGAVKPSIAPSVNFGRREDDVKERNLRYEEQSSYFDLPLRFSFVLESYFQLHIGAGITLYNMRVAITDHPGLNIGTNGNSNRTGIAPMADIGFRFFYQSFSFGISISGANNALAITNYTYQSQNGLISSNFEEISSVSLRVSLFFSGLF